MEEAIVVPILKSSDGFVVGNDPIFDILPT